MGVRMVFVISAPRSGSTMLERMLESHSMILGGPEPHLLTPLAHLGFWDKVDKAPYDPEQAAASLHRFVEALPGKAADYRRACRAYCDVLYGRYLAASDKQICLDKTPAYALILPFMTKVFPDAHYIVLTRHPLATFSSYANSFFDGDYAAAHAYNPILHRYVPALARFLRQNEVPYVHVRYKDLVKRPEPWMEKIYTYIGVPFEKETIDYGKQMPEEERLQGLGDPIGVERHIRPTTASISKWVGDLAADPDKRSLMEEVIGQIAPEDVRTIGYPLEELWRPLEEIDTASIKPRKERFTFYRVQRKLIVKLRAVAQKGGIFRKVLGKTQAVCQNLLRE